MKYVGSHNKLEIALKESNKIPVVDETLNEIKNRILLNFGAEFEIVGKLPLGDQITETHSRLRKMDDFESYFKPSMKHIKQKMLFLLVIF